PYPTLFRSYGSQLQGLRGCRGGGLKTPRHWAGAWLLPLRRSAVGAIGDEVVDHAGIGEGGGIAEGVDLVGGDLAQDAAHDLARAGLGQAGRPLDDVGAGDRADLLAHQGDQVLFELLGGADAVHQGDVALEAMGLNVVREADDGGLGGLGVRHQRALDLGGAHAVAGDVEHVVDPAGDPVVAVGIAAGAVAGDVLAGRV